MSLDEGEAKYDAAKAAFEEEATDETKEAYTSASVDLALAVMDSGLPPNQMYPRALGLFRDVLKVDPENVPAQEWIATIEGIYESMGRPVPEPTEDAS